MGILKEYIFQGSDSIDSRVAVYIYTSVYVYIYICIRVFVYLPGARRLPGSFTSLLRPCCNRLRQQMQAMRALIEVLQGL